MRRSIVLTDIGNALEQVITKVQQYHDDGITLASIRKSIRSIEEEDRRQHYMINFYGLQNHRSTSSGYGASFLQENRVLFLSAQRYLDSTSHLRNAAIDFMTNPASLTSGFSPHLKSDFSSLQPFLILSPSYF